MNWELRPRSETSGCDPRFLDDSRRSSKPEDDGGKSASSARQSRCDVVPGRKSQSIIMKAELVEAASKVITSPQILVNMVSRRVRQLTLGHRPLVLCAPGLGTADIALTEIANGKLTWESTFGQDGTVEPARIVLFPVVAESKKAKKAVTKKAA